MIALERICDKSKVKVATGIIFLNIIFAFYFISLNNIRIIFKNLNLTAFLKPRYGFIFIGCKVRWLIKAMLEFSFILFTQYNILFPQEISITQHIILFP